jgi:hypothetical protein
VETLSKDAFEFWEARMVCSNKGAEFGVMGGLGEGPDGMRKEGMGLVMRITSGEEGLVKD